MSSMTIRKTLNDRNIDISKNRLLHYLQHHLHCHPILLFLLLLHCQVHLCKICSDLNHDPTIVYQLSQNSISP